MSEPLPTHDPLPPRNPRGRVVVAAVVLVVSAMLLLARLGHHPLWDDEAITALSAEGILRSGDTSAVIDHNLVAYGGGILLHDLHDRSTPPLPAYIVATSFAALGHSALAARLPFALLGVLCVVMMLRWLWRDRATLVTWCLFAAALFGNVSFFLYFRNSRYYGVAILCSVLIAYLYLHWTGRRSTLIAMAAVSICLLASNYLNFIALYVCLAIDYFLFRRAGQPRLTMRDWIILLAPQVIVGLAIVSIWNPLSTGNAAAFWASGIGGKWITFLRSLRDLNACEYGALPLLLAAPLFYLRLRDPWLLRAPAALLAYLLVMALLAPTPVTRSHYADVRYLAPIIPLCIAIEVLVLRHLWTRWRIPTVVLAILAFGTNVLHGGMFRAEGVRSTIVEFAGELLRPPPDPYSAAIAFVRQHVHDGQTVAVMPAHMTYPLMFHAPKARYAWQLRRPEPEHFRGLDPILFQYEGNPDYVIVFGPLIEDVQQSGMLEGRQVTYVPFERLGHYWQDRYRPELMFHLFNPVPAYDPRTQDIYIFKAL